MEIREVDWGVANNFGDYIEVNRNLKKYPKLYAAIMKHELEHSKKPFSFKDLKLDLSQDYDLKTYSYLKFLVTYPKSLLQFVPFYWTKEKGFVIDISLIIRYCFFSLVLLGIIYVGIKIL